MNNNITRADLDALIAYLRQENPMLTQSQQVRLFEQEWSEWLGVKHSVFVNSGSSANLLTMAALRERFGPGEIVVPTLTWVSDIASVIQCGFKPVFVDINPRTLGMDDQAGDRPADPADAGGLHHPRAWLQRPHPAAAGRTEGPQYPAHRGCLRVSRRHLQRPQARRLRPDVQLLVLLRSPHEHHRGRHDLHRRS